MRFVQHSDPLAFRYRVDDFLLRNEAMHNTIIGITSRVIQGETYEHVFLGHVEDEQGEILLVTMRTVPHGPVLSNVVDPAAIPLVVDAYASTYDQLPTVLGRPAECRRFAEFWQERTGQAFHVFMEQGIYRLTHVKHPAGVPGSARTAHADDFEMLVTWLMHFSDDTGLGPISREDAERNIQRRLDHPILGGIAIWLDDDQPVSIAAVTRESPNGGVVSLVYTPPEYRKRGYASAVTAHVSQQVLNAGKTFASLYTDLANPTSNKIYQAIGYEHVGDHCRIKFEIVD